MRRGCLIAGVVLLLGASGFARADESVRTFRDLSFDAALKEAAAQKKVVMVDFYTPMCGPCKRMDLTTWLDPAVASYLDGKAISLRIDAWKETKLAETYHIGEYPTMLIVRPDGTEIDRLLGFRPSEKFLADFKDTLAGRTSLQRAREAAAAAAAKGDAVAVANHRKEIASILSQKGDPAEALKEYLWLFDDGMKKLPAFDGVRRTYVPLEIRELGRKYPPALAALRERQAAAKKALMGPGFTEADARDYSALNWTLSETAITLKLFDSLPPGDPRRPPLGRQLFGQLLSARRYGEAADAYPAEKIRSEFDEGAKDAWSPHPDGDKDFQRMNREYQMENAAQGIEALAGAGKLDGARDLMKRMLAVEDSPWVRAILLKHLKRAGRAELLGAG
jgi:thiol-disulfide isomerase/thioredoxin